MPTLRQLKVKIILFPGRRPNTFNTINEPIYWMSLIILCGIQHSEQGLTTLSTLNKLFK